MTQVRFLEDQNKLLILFSIIRKIEKVISDSMHASLG